MVPRSEIEQRIITFQNLLVTNGLAGAVIVQQADLFYYSGTAQNAHLVIPAAGEPLLIVKKSLQRAKEETRIDNITAYKNWNNLGELIKDIIPPKTKIGFEADVIPAKIYSRYEELLDKHYLVDVSGLVRRQRMIKSNYELSLLQEAAAISNSVFTFAANIIKTGMSEVELAGLLEQHARRMGHQGLVRMRGFNQYLYYGHIMSGENAATESYFEGPTGGSGLNPSFPQGAGFRKIKRHEPILVDFVSITGGYMVDQTRIFSLGKISEHLMHAYNTAVTIKNTLAQKSIPAVTCHSLYEKAISLAVEAGLDANFMGYPDPVPFIGHGVGLELDELPVLAKGLEMPLTEGMVLALEPKFVFPKEGTVGIEDTYVVAKEGLVKITFFAEELIIL